MRACFRGRVFALLVIASAAAGRIAGQEATETANPPAGAPAQEAPAFFVHLDVNHQTRSYRDGDNLSVKAVSEVDCYAYVVYHQADGKSFLVFPNSMQKDNRLKAK